MGVLAAVAALPVLPLPDVAIWGGAYLLVTALEHLAFARRSWRGRRLASTLGPFAISTLHALAATALIQAGDGAARFFAVALIGFSAVNILLRFYNAPRLFLAAMAPHAAVLGLVCFGIFMRSLAEGEVLKALTAPAVLATYALLLLPMRRQLADTWRKLVEAKAAAEQASKAKSEFLATMSHEIRTPLNGVLGLAQAMQRDPLPPDQKERLRMIRRSGETLLSILNDALDLSKIEAGQLTIESEEFDMEHITRGAVATFAPLAGAKGLEFEFSIAEPAKGTFRGDSVRLRQILYNLVSNAVKFTDAGRIGVCVSYADGRVSLEVADSGQGIPPGKIERLFDSFVQGDASTTRRFGGTGLGLSICRQLATLMGGSIEATSVEGRGSVFAVNLPLARIAEARPRTQPVPAAASAPPPRPIRILAAEDNPVNQVVLKTLLTQAGVEPVVVDNGQEAVEAWRTQAWDVILMDIQMPLMDGVAATREIRSFEATASRARTPIIAVTANAMAHQVAEYAAAGMDRVVAKPLDAAELFEAIEQALAGDDEAAATTTAAA